MSSSSKEAELKDNGSAAAHGVSGDHDAGHAPATDSVEDVPSASGDHGPQGGLVSVGSRRSELALTQTREVLGRLCRLDGDRRFSIVHMDTVGDVILDRALSLIGDKGLFTRELDAALLSGQVQFVVHSLKDLPTQCPDGLTVPCILRRELPWDALVLHPRHTGAGVRDLSGLPAGSVLGTSSLRRAAQLSRAHPGLRFESVRGNLGTRWRKLLAEGSGLDGLILAEAGMARLGWSDRITCRLTDCLPAVGQGALAVQCRADDSDTCRLLRPLLDRPTFLEVTAERSLLRALDGGCSVPLGVRTTWPAEGTLRLEARVLSTDGAELVDFSAEVRLDDDEAEEEASEEPAVKRARPGQPEAAVGLHYPDADARDLAQLAGSIRLGRTVAEGLLALGAGPVLAAAKAAAKAAVGKLQPSPPRKPVAEVATE